MIIAFDQRHEEGPFDIIGDVHGCYHELTELLNTLGYTSEEGNPCSLYHHPLGRRLCFVGDLVDRGPSSPDVLRMVMQAVEAGRAFCVNGNHEDKLKRQLLGHPVQVLHGLQETLDQLSKEDECFKNSVRLFLRGLPPYLILDHGRLVVVHAGIKEEYLGRITKKIQAFCLYGQTTNQRDEKGLPVRYPWAQDYRGDSLVVYGHTVVTEPVWQNNTVNIDTGCVFGGHLTAFRYPEKEVVSIKAKHIYYPR